MSVRTNKRLVRSLMSRIRAYERFFKEKEKSQKTAAQKEKKAGGGTGGGTGALEPDNQAHTAYVNLIKLVHALEKDTPQEDEGMREKLTQEKVREVLRDVYGISAVSE